jgi:hypothetical protein
MMSESMNSIGGCYEVPAHGANPDSRALQAPTRRQCAAAAAASGPRQQARAVQRRQARLAEFGFTDVDEYLRDRCVGRGWSVRRLCAELGVGHGWPDQQLTRLGLRTDLMPTDDLVRLPAHQLAEQ